ncbi:hypothetical protein Rhopal_002121-T1 [Rhodotorula paludigena]|uniref:Uncharacterized protein n=1 Tax=Rhodotorula paludigena TaxID=86838 RepID=A0AAV5GIE7_9BASI|nr:hypothetical protein Rhopal_002121-T1 [Rhodotorula paludigena]
MTTIPGYVNSLKDLPKDDSLAEAIVQGAVKDTGALAWGRFTHWPSKAWVLYPDEASARHAHPLLHLTDRLDFDSQWFSSCDLAQMLERLEHSHFEPASAAAASTRFITFMSLPGRIKLFKLVKANLLQRTH